MKDDVEFGRFTKFDSSRLNRDQVMDLEEWFKLHTNVSNFCDSVPKTIQTLYFFYDYCDIVKKLANFGKFDFHQFLSK